MEIKIKYCTKCKTEKLLNEFYLRKTRKNRLISWCVACYCSAGKQYRKTIQRHIKKQENYGIKEIN